MIGDYDEAQILNQFFCCVFTVQNTLYIPETNWQYEGHKLVGIIISADCVCLSLERLKVTGSPGPDNIPSRVLSEAADSLAVPLSILFRQSLDSGCLPEDCRLGSSPYLQEGLQEFTRELQAS